ncbi:MAG TPA: mercuric reductase [Verrucomicrobiae bacterium]|nr:mercuric reductase [Verrucomicrobiae bacterium]
MAKFPDNPPLTPWDEPNRRLWSNVHPPDWVNPTPTGRYNLVVIGGGTAGLVTAAGAAGLGAKVALIERHLLGGDCLNTGCVPSKALVRCARAIAAAREAGKFGARIPGEVSVDFPAIMERMRSLRAEISPHDSAARFRKLGVDVFIGQGQFTGPGQIQVADRMLRFARGVIATGARAAVPTIPGLDKIRHLTNETLFSLTELPKRLAIIGAGPVGCEMAQTFARFGSEVTLIANHHGILPREDRDAAAVIESALARDGVKLLCCAKDLRAESATEDARLLFESHGQPHVVITDQVLVATGRVPNVEGMGLDVAGVQVGARGVIVNDRLQTTSSRVFACGDVCGQHQFTHAADFMARLVIQNALFHGRKRTSDLLVPWATYTSPELAHVGLSEHEAKERGISVDVFTQEFAQLDRAILDGTTEGFAKVLVKRGTDQILGATVVGEHAGNLICELAVAMNGKIGLGKLGATIHPYPTHAEALRKLGDAWSRTRLTPLVKWLFAHWLEWQR